MVVAYENIFVTRTESMGTGIIYLHLVDYHGTSREKYHKLIFMDFLWVILCIMLYALCSSVMWLSHNIHVCTAFASFSSAFFKGSLRLDVQSGNRPPEKLKLKGQTFPRQLIVRHSCSKKVKSHQRKQKLQGRANCRRIPSDIVAAPSNLQQRPKHGKERVLSIAL